MPGCTTRPRNRVCNLSQRTSRPLEPAEWSLCLRASGWAKKVSPTDTPHEKLLACTKINLLTVEHLLWQRARASRLRPQAAQPRVLSQTPPQHRSWLPCATLPGCSIGEQSSRWDTLRASLNKSSMLHDDHQPRKHSVNSLYMPASAEPGTPSKSHSQSAKRTSRGQVTRATRGRRATLLRACQCRPTLLELFHCFKRASAELQSLLPLFIVIGHKCNELARNAIEVRPLEERNSLEMIKPQEVAKRMRHGPGLWPLTKAYIPELRHTNPCVAPKVRCMPHPHTRAQRVTRKVSPSSSTKKKHCQEIPCIGTSLPASISRGKLHVNNDDGHRTSASATEDVPRRRPAYASCSRAAARCPNPKAARHAACSAQLATTARFISWRSRMTSTVLFVLVTNGGDCHQEASSRPNNRPSGDASTWSSQRSSIPM